MNNKELLHRLMVLPGSKISLKKDYDPGWVPDDLSKEDAEKKLQEGIQLLAHYQDMLYAQDAYALLIIFQAMDAAGKDGTIKHVMTGLNPQGCEVYSFKAPSTQELDHDYLWRCCRALPERGRIGIFNRSYYEEVLVVRVHPEILDRQHMPLKDKSGDIWQRRFREINNFERYLVSNGIIVLKFFLHLSRDEQKERFLERIDRTEKNWKFSAADVKERAFWNDYRRAYEDVFNHTSTKWAPWYIVPADHKWFTHLAVSTVIHSAMKDLDLECPKPNKEHLQELQDAKKLLESEK